MESQCKECEIKKITKIWRWLSLLTRVVPQLLKLGAKATSQITSVVAATTAKAIQGGKVGAEFVIKNPKPPLWQQLRAMPGGKYRH